MLKICEKLKIPETEYSLNKNNMNNILKNLNISEKDRNEYVKTHENNTINTYLDTKADVGLIRSIVLFDSILKENQYNNLDTEIEELQSFLDKYYSESKFFKNVVDENGKFDQKKAMKFLKNFKEEREKSDLEQKLNKYSVKRHLSKEDKEEVVTTFVMTIFRGDKINKKLAVEIAKSHGIDVLDKKGNLDKDKIEQYGKLIYGKDFNFEEILEKNTFEGQVALDQLNRIEASIERGDTKSKPTSLEEVNKAKEEAKKNEKRICSLKEKKVYDVINSLNLSNNYYKSPENAKQLILLFCKFRDDEINANNHGTERAFNSNSVNSGRNDTVSGIIKKYMREHEDAFGEYLRSDGSLNPQKIMEVLEEGKLSINKSANIMITYEQIKRRTDEIEKLEKDKGNQERLNGINKLLKKSKVEELSDIEKAQLYSLVKDSPAGILSTEKLEDLKKLDEEKFNEAVKGKNVVKKVGRDSLGAIYFSAARLFVKGVYALPKMIVDKEARKEYIPKIKKHIKSGGNRITNLMKESKKDKDKKQSLFSFFNKNKQKQLTSGNNEEIIHNDSLQSDRISNSQQSYKETNNSPWRSEETIGCDVGIAKNMPKKEDSRIVSRDDFEEVGEK